jgi:SAM-dependent methyltransferase
MGYPGMQDPGIERNATEYGEIFDLRGNLYHRAMREYPECREQEFLSVIAQAEITPGMTVVDVPSGGAYLARYLQDVVLIGLETSEAFARLGKGRTEHILLYENDLFPLEENSSDRVLSIAGLHHVQDKRGIFREAYRVLKPGGRLVIADVAGNSFVASFLDEFVGKYCETGHSGWYFNDDTRKELESSGLEVKEDQLLDYAWYASSKKMLGDFCHKLFGMVQTDSITVEKGIEDRLGLIWEEGRVGMKWQLRCLTCDKVPAAEGAQ